MTATTLSQPTNRIPPGPAGLPFVGNLFSLQRDTLGFFTRCAQTYGDVCRLRFLGNEPWLISDPNLIDQILTTTEGRFSKHPPGANDIFLGNGLLNSVGDFWLRQRRMMQPAFHRNRINRYADDTLYFTEEMFKRWQEGEVKRGKPVDIQAEMMRVTLEIAAQSLFHVDVSKGQSFEVGDAMEVIMDLIARERGNLLFRLPFHPAHKQFVQAVESLNKVIFAMIEARRQANDDAGDLLSMLLHAQDEDGNHMNDKQLRDEAITMFLAGHETTALSMTWTLYLLAQNRNVEKKLVEELHQVLNGRSPTLADIPKLTYTEKVLKESMRVYPPAWIVSDRFITVDGELGGYPIRKGTTVLVSQWLAHHDARWFPDPWRFQPERWTEEFQKRLPRYAYFPFGGGPRFCIGSSFATMESTLLLAAIMQRYRFELTPNQRVTLQPAITLRAKNGIWGVIKERQ